LEVRTEVAAGVAVGPFAAGSGGLQLHPNEVRGRKINDNTKVIRRIEIRIRFIMTSPII
jgi:hypothetical protein